MSTQTLRALVYTRLSLADQLPDGSLDTEAVERQERACRSMAKARGWRVVDVITDNSISASAYSRKTRTGWAEVLQRMADGSVDVVVAQHLDRITRKLRDVEDLVDLVRDTGCAVVTVDGMLDLTNADGIAMARVGATFAAHQSDSTSRRMKSQRADRARRGTPVVTVDGFGWRNGAPVPAEADAIRDGAVAVVGGATLASVAREWNSRGLPRRRTSRPWRSQDVRVVLTNPRHTGLAVYRGEVVAESDGAPRILERDLFDAVTATLADPARGRGPRRRRALSGVLRCGRCGNVLRRGAIGTPPRSGWSCPRGSGGCGGLAVTAEPVEAAITEAVLRVLDDGVPVAPSVIDPEAADVLARIDRESADLGTAYGTGDVPLAIFLAASKALEVRRAEAVERLTPARTAAALAPYSKPGAVRKAWPDLDEPTRNVIVRALVDAVVIEPAEGRQAPEDRIGEIRWRA